MNCFVLFFCFWQSRGMNLVSRLLIAWRSINFWKSFEVLDLYCTLYCCLYALHVASRIAQPWFLCIVQRDEKVWNGCCSITRYRHSWYHSWTLCSVCGRQRGPQRQDTKWVQYLPWDGNHCYRNTWHQTPEDCTQAECQWQRSCCERKDQHLLLQSRYQYYATTHLRVAGSGWLDRPHSEAGPALESILAPPLTKAWMVGHDAGCLSRWIPRPVIHNLSANDQHELKWPELHLFNPDICLCGSQASQGDTSHYLWPAPVVEGSDHPGKWTTWEWTAFTGRTSWRFPCRDELFGLHWPCNVWIWPPGSARGRVLSNTVTHILSGKALARAVRGHLLVDSALNAMAAAETFNMWPLEATKTCGPADPESDERLTEDDPLSASSLSVSEVMDVSSWSGSGEMDVDSGEESASATLDKDLAAAVELYDKVVSGELSVQDLCSSRCLDKIQEKLEAQKIQMAAKRTSKLWLQYMEMVDILRLFIKA